MKLIVIARGFFKDENITWFPFLGVNVKRSKFLKHMKKKKFIVIKKEIFTLEEVILYSVVENEETFKVLFEEGLVPDYIPNPRGFTLMMLSCHGSNYENVKLLLERGDDVNAKTERGNNSLYYIHDRPINYFHNVTSIWKLLFCHGINLKNQNNLGDTILHRLSAKHERQNCIKEVLTEALFSGKEYLEEFIEMKNSKGETALIYAAKNNRIENVKVFLTYRADLFAIDKEGKTFLDYLTPENKGLIERFLDVLEIENKRRKKGIHRS